MKPQARSVTSLLPSSLCPTRAPSGTQGTQRSHTGRGRGSSLGSSRIPLRGVLDEVPSWAGALHECPGAAVTSYCKQKFVLPQFWSLEA